MMFAATPIWERNRKRRGLGGRKAAAAAAAPTVAPEPRTFTAERDHEAPMALDQPVTDRPVTTDYSRAEYADMGPSATATNSTLAAEDDAGLAPPIGRTDRQPRSKGVGPAVIGAGAAALVAIGAAGWFMTRDSEGVPELAPGSTTSEVAAAPLPVPATDLPPSPPAEVAVTPAPPAPVMTARAEPPRVTARVTPRARPAAAAPSASSSGVNASTSAVLPDGPQPYSSLNPGATPPPVDPAVNQAAPAPSEAPAEIPATPPTATPEPIPTPPSEDPTPPQATPTNA